LFDRAIKAASQERIISRHQLVCEGWAIVGIDVDDWAGLSDRGNSLMF